jgi:hypothetical protein
MEILWVTDWWYLQIEWKMMPASMTVVLSVRDFGEYCCSEELDSDSVPSEASFGALDSAVGLVVLDLSNI